MQCLLNSSLRRRISSLDQEVFGLKYRPDAKLTKNPYNDVSYEHDDEKGHVCRTVYPAEDQHQRTVELNERRKKDRGKVTIRQHPLTIYESTQQTMQNERMIRVIEEYMETPLGQRSDGEGGKRVIVFIGFSHNNYHYTKALREKENGYWDEVRMLYDRDDLEA